MLGNIIYKGHSAFVQTKIQLEVFFDESVIDPSGKKGTRRPCDPPITAALSKRVSERSFPKFASAATSECYTVSSAVAPPSNSTKWCKQIRRLSDKRRPFGFQAAADIDVLQKGGIDTTLLENQRRVKDKELRWVESLKTTDAIQAVFNVGYSLQATAAIQNRRVSLAQWSAHS